MLYIIFIILLYVTPCISGPSVTYALSGGRLGDNLIAYLHAKWISYKLGIPLLYRPFRYSNCLKLNELEQVLAGTQYPQIKKISSIEEIDMASDAIYEIQYFPENCYEPEYYMNKRPSCIREYPNFFLVQWQDKQFLKEIRSLISPVCSLELIEPPKEYVSVAVHIRKNEIDKPLLTESKRYNPNQLYADVIWPLKFAPNSFYIEQIQRIADMYPSKQLYVFLFTDDVHPEKLARLYASRLNIPSIKFDYRENNSPLRNVLQDMFSMMKFDCLIHADSHLSVIAEKLGSFKVIITPLHNQWKGHRQIINKVNIIVSNELEQEE